MHKLPTLESDAMSSSDSIIDALRNMLCTPGLADLLEKSITQANARAHAELDPTLYAALPWPTDLGEYEEYLKNFIRWIPQQSDAEAWKSDAPQHRYAKEVSDRLAHFFWLTDQKVCEGDTAIAENSDAFKDWLTEFARQWGSFLDTPESFSQAILDSFLKNAPEYTIEESLVDGRPNMPSGWVTFNQFFARELNAGLRPIVEPASNFTVTSPADCSFQHGYDIDEDANIPATTIKGTHKYGNIKQLIDGSGYADAFAGGTFVHYMLPPSAYHRFHAPVSGVVKESFVVQGKVFMQVDLEDHELKSKDAANTGYEFSQTRGVLTIDTTGEAGGDLGIVAVVPVGMSHVASVVMTATKDRHIAKGEEFGYFQFGGSDIIIVFQARVKPEIDTDTKSRKVGSVVARISPPP